MRYIEAPENYLPNELNSIFLAGGITGCPDWQQEIVEILKDSNLTLLNPRRKDFPIGDPSAAQVQITWEYHALNAVNGVLFWFPCETICPIVLYELGRMSGHFKPIWVGVHPDYQRRQDVEIQTGLVRKDVEIVYSLEDLAEQVCNFTTPHSRDCLQHLGILEKKRG